jgi:hypothetical protein
VASFWRVVGKFIEANGIDAFRKEFAHRGIEVPYTKKVGPLIHQKINEFLGSNIARYGPMHISIAIHKPSDEKTNIGYEPKNVAITLAYQDAEGNNSYLLFSRENPDQKIPRGILKKIIGHDNLASAARQAELGLNGVCTSGSMGPFFLKENDNVFICEDTNQYHNDKPGQLANFSGGHGMVSVNLPFGRVVDFLEARNPMRTHICSLTDADKFRDYIEHNPLLKEALSRMRKDVHMKRQQVAQAKTEAKKAPGPVLNL